MTPDQASIANSLACRRITAQGLQSPDLILRISQAVDAISSSFGRGGKLLLCGNGGSAADCQHVAAELVGRFAPVQRRALPAISLACDTSILTALSNDWDYSYVFRRQIEALAGPEDVVLAISTSGNSPNVIQAAEICQERGIYLIGLTGGDGGLLASLCDLSIVAPGTSTALIQECHLMIEHIICEHLELRQVSIDRVV